RSALDRDLAARPPADRLLLVRRVHPRSRLRDVAEKLAGPRRSAVRRAAGLRPSGRSHPLSRRRRARSILRRPEPAALPRFSRRWDGQRDRAARRPARGGAGPAQDRPLGALRAGSPPGPLPPRLLVLRPRDRALPAAARRALARA